MAAEERGELEAAGVAALVTAITIGSSVAAVPFALVARDRGVAFVARAWARACLRVAGIEAVLVERGAPLTPPYLVMANHTSHTDVLAMYAVLPVPVRFVAKQELAWVPVFGQVLMLGAAIMIDRRSLERAKASLERAGAAIRRGASVVMFPEGTRTPAGVLGPLKKGPLHLAEAARVPILPVGIVGSGAALPAGDWRARPGRIEVRLGAPIPPMEGAGEEARARLAAEVSRALCELAELTPQTSLDTAK